MSEESSDEKVFPATDRKRREARKQGQVAKSPELAGAAVLLALLAWIHATLNSGSTLNDLLGDFQSSFSFNPHPTGISLETTSELFKTSSLWGMRLILPGLLLAVAVGLMTNIAQVGLQITPESLKPKFDKLNPANGIKRMFSKHGAVEVGKGILKIGIIGYLVFSVIEEQLPTLLSASQSDLFEYMSAIGAVMWTISLRVATVMFIIAAFDFGYQRFEFEKNLKMTFQEMKQEHKQNEGDPLLKQKIRQKQRQMASRKMMKDVPKADVVITNPTHFAVAIKYEGGSMTAPKVVAKGQDFMAQKIKEVAREANVPLVENVKLARALYAEVEIGREIPGELYQAVAEVLAFVYRTYKRKPAGIGKR